MLLKRDDNSKNILMNYLRKINDHLGERGTRFLTGDTMCCFDCELMPKLQHIRVAGKICIHKNNFTKEIVKYSSFHISCEIKRFNLCTAYNEIYYGGRARCTILLLLKRVEQLHIMSFVCFTKLKVRCSMEENK